MNPNTTPDWIPKPAQPQPKARRRYVVDAGEFRLYVDGSRGFAIDGDLLRFTSADGLLTAFPVANVTFFQEQA